MDKIYWLASYPKSGNTWVRAFLSNYLNEGDEPADINRLDGGPIASDRELFDRWAGVESSDLPLEDIDCLRPDVYREMARHIQHPLYLKVHDARIRNKEDEFLFPADVTGGILYIIRNPLDVAVSFSHHFGKNLEDTIKQLTNPEAFIYNDQPSLRIQLPTHLLDWSSHIRSWVDESGLPVCVVRYEDMTYNPDQTFPKIVSALNLTLDPARLKQSILFSSFDQLQKQENEKNFKERHVNADTSFFRKGKTGSWREELSQQQAQKLLESHGDLMLRFGYLDQDGRPIY